MASRRCALTPRPTKGGCTYPRSATGQKEIDLKNLQLEVDAREADRNHKLEIRKIERKSST